MTSAKSDLSYLLMALLDNGDPKEFLSFVRKFNMTLAASGMLATGDKIQYLCTLVHVELLHQFDSMSTDVEGTNPLTVETIILELCVYFFPVNLISKQKCAMRCVMRKPCVLKVRQYADHFIDLNEYLALFPGAKQY